MVTPLRNAALLLLGHGSTLNADSSAPTYQHAEEIRRRGVFAEVHVAFWKEEPNFRQALRLTSCRQVYVVPNFISSGYFTEQIIPRELELGGPLTRRNGQDIFYCEPVGLHPSMTEALLRRAGEVVAQSGETLLDPSKTACLFICGHGTSLNDNSTKIIHEQAALIRSRGLYADCQAVLMEQAPFVKDWRKLTTCPDVIVVPFFISDGLHSFEDIPVLLGLTHNIKEKGFRNPHREGDRRLWYATAIGTEAFIADVILAQVEKFNAYYDKVPQPDLQGQKIAERELTELFRARTQYKIGQVLVHHPAAGEFELRHVDDEGLPAQELNRLRSLPELRELIRVDSQGRFRPLRAAPNLRRGWLMSVGRTEIRTALDYLYPAAVANWTLLRRQKLAPTPWHATAERQTGRFRIVRELDGAALRELAECNCQAGCLKRRLWRPEAKPTATMALFNEIPLLCPEACNFLVGKAREKLKGPEEE